MKNLNILLLLLSVSFLSISMESTEKPAEEKVEFEDLPVEIKAHILMQAFPEKLLLSLPITQHYLTSAKKEYKEAIDKLNSFLVTVAKFSATSKQHYDLVTYLKNLINKKIISLNPLVKTSLLDAAISKKALKVAELLLNLGAAPKMILAGIPEGEKPIDPLSEAIRIDSLPMVKLLIDKNATVSFANLGVAAGHGNKEIFDFLINEYPDIRESDYLQLENIARSKNHEALADYIKSLRLQNLGSGAV